MRKTLPAILIACAAVSLHAQDHSHDGPCTAHSITEQYLHDKGMSTDLGQALAGIQGTQRGGGGALVIPVVFHVVYNTAAENIPASAIQAVVNQMNQDYSASNPNLGSVRPTFQGSIDNVGIQFCLADTDPNGNPTNGITRTPTTDTWFDPDTQTNDMKSPPLGISSWNPLEYLNIWVCDIHSGAGGGGITLGYAYLPVGGMVGSDIDGIVIDYLYGMSLANRTATHEAGHYLGLQHPWGNGGCGSDDGFSDTPNTDSPTFSCSNQNLMKCGVLTQYENFMDYSDCSAMFTIQQGNYMTNVLTGVRSGLLSSDGCSGSGSTGYCVPGSANGTADGDFVNSVQLGSINNNNTGGPSAPTYTDYSSTMSTELEQGADYTITLQSGTYTPNRVAAWIDYNGDEVFQASEKLGEFQTTAAMQSQGIPFTVPAGAAVGATRMRVRSVYVNTGEPNPADPCFSYAWGETEDYGIVITAPPPTGYCIPTSANGTADGDFVNSVQLGSINNNNTGGPSAPPYTNYSSTMSTELEQGAGYTITIQSGTYTPNRVAAWIDFNGDMIFQPGEKLGEFQTTAAMQSQGIPFTVPAGATLGATRMRVRSVYVNTGEPNPADPCFAYAWGETEDYGIVITEPAPTGYCIPTSTNGTTEGDFVNSVQLGSINNTNSGGMGVPPYDDNTAQSTMLLRNAEYTITIQSGEYSPNAVAAWIDYNGDQVFQSNEKLGEFQTSGSMQSQGIPFTVPMSADLGNTRLRVRSVYINTGEPSPADPCFNYAWGETEDYTVLIDGTLAVADAHAAGMTLFPNPATQTTTLLLPDASAAEITLVDMLGRTVRAQQVAANRVDLDVSDLAAGGYLVRVTQNGQMHSLRLAVTRH